MCQSQITKGMKWFFGCHTLLVCDGKCLGFLLVLINIPPAKTKLLLKKMQVLFLTWKYSTISSFNEASFSKYPFFSNSKRDES